MTDLSNVLASSSSDKARLAAVAALARLGDRRALKPLVTALNDPNAQVRAVAAAALGKLGHKAALPSLTSVATADLDATVRSRAKESAIQVAKANQLPSPWPAAVPVKTASARKAGRAGFGNQPRALETQADLFVSINSSADDSPGRTDKKARKAHADIIRQVLNDKFNASQVVTTIAADAQKRGLDSRHLDLSVTKMDVTHVGSFVEVEAQLRLAISDDTGKMLSFLSGGAKVQVPRRTYDARYLPNLRREALENAMRGMFDKLLAHLRDRSQS